VLPNGIALCWGPWRGSTHDATMLLESGLLEDLSQASEDLGLRYSAFADSAYPRSAFVQRVERPDPGGNLTQTERRYNALMSRFRIVIENAFGETTNYFNNLTHRHNLRLGSQQVGKMFPIAILLFNLHTILYGNQTAAYFETEDVLISMTVNNYLSKMHN